MEYVDSSTLKPKQARELVTELQQRIYRLENCLDDLSRSVEIAQFSKQYQVTEAFVRDAEELLTDRIVIPEIKQNDAQFTIVEGEISEETVKGLRDKFAKKAGE